MPCRGGGAAGGAPAVDSGANPRAPRAGPMLWGVRPDPFILAALIAGSGWAVWSQLKHEPAAVAAPIQALAIGEPMEDVALKDPTGDLHTLSQWRGKSATVLYFWSLECPCVAAQKFRIQDAYERYSKKGVTFVAIDSHPDDKGSDVLAKMGELYAPYYMLLDPTGKLSRLVGGRTATDLVVLDADWKIRYRGSFDDDLVKPKKPYLAPALDAILDGRSPDPSETKPYGCPFPGIEGSCPIEDAAPKDPKKPGV
jgi:peroxiredoxin